MTSGTGTTSGSGTSSGSAPGGQAAPTTPGTTWATGLPRTNRSV